MDILAAHHLARKFDISTAAIAILSILKDKGPQPLSNLANALGYTASALTSTADLLTRRGLALRQPSTGDRRVQFLTLTEAGENVIPS